MKNHKGAVSKQSVTADPPDLERRKVTKLIGALTLLGMGLGVNLEETFAGMKKPSVNQNRVPTPKASVGYWKKEKPSVNIDKAGRSQSSGYTHKLKTRQNAPIRPGATRVKPVPAAASRIVK